MNKEGKLKFSKQALVLFFLLTFMNPSAPNLVMISEEATHSMFKGSS